MTKISVPGKGDKGYILIDILVALLVASIGFTSLFSAIHTAVRFSVKQETQLIESIEIRNVKDSEFESQIIF